MSNSIHPTAIISGEVTLGRGNVIGPHVIITGPVAIGDDNWIGAGAVIGAPPEVRSFEHPRSQDGRAGNGVLIGSRNIIREYVQIHQGWKEQTRLGDDLFIMNQAYIAHDCHLANGVTLASSVLLAGHVVLGAGANLGLGTSVLQRVRIGRGAMIGMGSVVTRDIPPLAKAFGNPAHVHGANIVGMERTGFSQEAIEQAVSVYEEKDGPRLSVFTSVPELAAIFEGWMVERPIAENG